jgi:putative tricarboxylic transport membrane protein
MQAPTPPAPQSRSDHRTGQLALGIAAVLLAAGLAYGAANIPSDAGYAGVGPNFLPWVVRGRHGALRCLADLGGAHRRLSQHARTFGRGERRLACHGLGIGRHSGQRSADHHHRLRAELCPVLHAGGARFAASAKARPLATPCKTVKDVVIGMLISAPTFWLFTKFLGVNLPGLTGTGWL